MRTIVDIGKKGGEHLTDVTPAATELSIDDPKLQNMLAFIRKIPAEMVPVDVRQTVEAEVDGGTKRTVAVRPLLLSNSIIFGLVHKLAPYEPMVYATSGERRVFGMVSPNYDTSGQDRLPSIKVIPLQVPYPLTSKLEPDARMATMLAGAAQSESKGVGSHEGVVPADLEHRATILGAISLNNHTLAVGHKNHYVRDGYTDPKTGLIVPPSSVVTGLTNGELGNLYARGSDDSEFSGYAEPMIFQQGQVTRSDVLYIPDSFLDSEAAFGVSYPESSMVMLGAGLQRLYEGRGRDMVNREMATLAGAV